MVRELGMKPGDRVLDVGCGTSRHSIPLAKLGMDVCGLDLSAGMLARAKDYAENENVKLELVQADATRFHLPEPFDHVICICEGAVGLLGPDEDAAERDLLIMKNIGKSLKPGGMLLMTVLNGLKKIREHSPEDVENGLFDPVHLVSMETIYVDARREPIRVREKGFAPGELFQLLKQSDLELLHLWGGTAGAWEKKELKMDEYEIMVIARKTVP